MKKLTTTLVMVIALVFGVMLNSVAASEPETTNTKIMLHGVKTYDNSHFGISGWLILPNPGNKAAVAVAGGKYSGNNWWVELNFGAFVKENKGEALIDFRAAHDKVFGPLNCFTNIQYYTRTNDWLTYADVNCHIGTICLLGLETENMHFDEGQADDYGYGPRVVLPFSKHLIFIGAYQFHSGPNQIWARAVLNF